MSKLQQLLISLLLKAQNAWTASQDATSPVRTGKVALNDLIKISDEPADSAPKPSSSIVREAKTVEQVASDGSIEIPQEDVDSKTGKEAADEYEKAKTALAQIADRVKLGDTALLQTGNRTSSKAPDRVTGKTLAGLVAAVAAGGATPEVIQVIEKVISTLETGALDKIKEDHNDTQAKIDADLADLGNKTVDAVNQHAVAVSHDTAWLTCVAEEKGLLADKETCDNELAMLLQSKWTKCNYSSSLANFTDTSTPPDLSFSCDFVADDCTSKLATLESSLDTWFNNLEATVAAEKSAYLSAKQACTNATSLHSSKITECNGKQTLFLDKELACERKKSSRSIAMCVFGDKLQAKCKQKQVYDTTIGQVDGTGTVYSDSERRGEWEAVGTIKCMLEKFKTSGTFTQAELTTCKSDTDYASGVGVLDKKNDVYQRLTAAGNFTCGETSITFNGSLWTVPGASAGPINSSQYTSQSHSFAVNASTGSKAFDFCKEGDNGPNCSTFPDSNCATYAPRPDATVCQLATGCTIADCCVLPR
jgi:uncharacterized protein YecT (DUF1311 family)